MIHVNTGSTDYERALDFVYKYSSLLGKKCQKVETSGVHISSWCLLYFIAYLMGVYVHLLYMRAFCCKANHTTDVIFVVIVLHMHIKMLKVLKCLQVLEHTVKKYLCLFC